MIIMALDHVRDFLHADALVFQSDDLSRTTAALFFTRWVTHFCAPVFMFTAGMSAYLWMHRGRTTGQLSRFLVSRGLWLVVLELTVLHVVLASGLPLGMMVVTILWALGWSMVALGALAYLSVRTLAVFSIAMIALHNLTDSIPAAQFGRAAFVWNILHQPGVFRVAGTSIRIGYPLIPWIGVMSAGFCFGRLMIYPPGRRQWWMTRIGLGITLAFLIVRAINIYGDPQPWNGAFLSFLRCTKYPPSLDFLLMTLGPALLVMSWFDRLRFSDRNPVIVFGRVPLFYFLLHLYVIAGVARVLGSRLHPLSLIYVWWIAIVAALYPVCLWYARLKRRKSWWWLSYV